MWTAPDGHPERDDVMLVERVTAGFDRGHTPQESLAERFAQQAFHVRAFAIPTLTSPAPPDRQTSVHES
jgi:hypothetical protein